MATVTMFVTSENNSVSERRFDKSFTIAKLKERLAAITGIKTAHQQLALYSKDDELLGIITDDEKMLGFFPVEDFGRIHVTDTNPYKVRGEFTDVSQVEKFELKDEEYEKRSESLRQFLKKNKLGKFSDAKETPEEEEEEGKEDAQSMKVGDRCQVETEGEMLKRGVVRFVGKTSFKPGYWVGVEYDEPLGKHNGSVSGVTYFESRPKHGAFVRPARVAVGKFPEESLDDELDEL
ncbi:tubulin folding cofactor B [Cladochytrium replicatum]|nr:tubulin folding cofactor B [Cladochytrium replicatum]